MEIIKKNSFSPPESLAPDSSTKRNGSVAVLSIAAVLALGAFIAYLYREKQRREEENSKYY